jgi:hypothetical protein
MGSSLAIGRVDVISRSFGADFPFAGRSEDRLLSDIFRFPSMTKDGLVLVGLGVDVTRDHAGGRSFLRISRVCIEMFMAHCSGENDLPKHFSLRKLLAAAWLSVSCAPLDEA